MRKTGLQVRLLQLGGVLSLGCMLETLQVLTPAVLASVVLKASWWFQCAAGMHTSAPGTLPETLEDEAASFDSANLCRSRSCTCLLWLTAENLASAPVVFISPSFALKKNSFISTENSKVNKEKEHLQGCVDKKEINI